MARRYHEWWLDRSLGRAISSSSPPPCRALLAFGTKGSREDAMTSRSRTNVRVILDRARASVRRRSPRTRRGVVARAADRAGVERVVVDETAGIEGETAVCTRRRSGRGPTASSAPLRWARFSNREASSGRPRRRRPTETTWAAARWTRPRCARGPMPSRACWDQGQRGQEGRRGAREEARGRGRRVEDAAPDPSGSAGSGCRRPPSGTRSAVSRSTNTRLSFRAGPMRRRACGGGSPFFLGRLGTACHAGAGPQATAGRVT